MGEFQREITDYFNLINNQFPIRFQEIQQQKNCVLLMNDNKRVDILRVTMLTNDMMKESGMLSQNIIGGEQHM